MSDNRQISKADLYEAAEKFFPEHDIVFTDGIVTGRRFTDCLVRNELVMRYCPPDDKYGCPPAIIIFVDCDEPIRVDLPEDVTIILENIKNGNNR
ncbi:MAG: hypothetical protein IKA48_00410 [Fibrobacter sp.]|nr:hypothetical protein [Fibrobacter sp.]